MILEKIETKKTEEIKQLMHLRFSMLMALDDDELSRKWATTNLRQRKICFEANLNLSTPSDWFIENFVGKTGEYADMRIRFDVVNGKYSLTHYEWVSLKDIAHV